LCPVSLPHQCWGWSIIFNAPFRHARGNGWGWGRCDCRRFLSVHFWLCALSV
jgi:hypothetical protein